MTSESLFLTVSELKAATWPVSPDPNWKPVLFYKPTKLLTSPQPDMPVATILTVLTEQSAANLKAMTNPPQPFPGELFAVVPDATPWPALSALIAEATAKYRLGAIYLDCYCLAANTDTRGWTAFFNF